MKRFFLILIPLAALLCVGATIQWFSDQPATTALADTDIVPLERPSPHGYKSFTLLTLKGYIGTNGVMVFNYITVQNITNNFSMVTNLFVYNMTNNIQYTTNIYVTEEYVTRLYNTYNTSYYSWVTNLFASNAFFTNIYVSFVTNDYIYTTNLYATYVTAKTAYITNLVYEGSQSSLYTWPGPTNSLNVSNQWQYVTYTPCAGTGFVGGVAGYASDFSLSLSNAASSNITFTITASDYWSGDFTNQYTLTNSERRTIAFRRIGTGLVEGLARWFQKMQ